MANNYYGLPVHGQPAQYTAAATAYPAAPAFVGQSTNTSYARAQAPVAAYTAATPYTPTYATPSTSIVASTTYPYPAAQLPSPP